MNLNIFYRWPQRKPTPLDEVSRLLHELKQMLIDFQRAAEAQERNTATESQPQASQKNEVQL